MMSECVNFLGLGLAGSTGLEPAASGVTGRATVSVPQYPRTRARWCQLSASTMGTPNRLNGSILAHVAGGRFLFIVLAVGLAAGCGSVKPSPTSPTPIQAPAPSPAPPAPVLPPFSVSLAQATTSTIWGDVFPGPWTAVIAVRATPGVVSPEIPTSVRVRCNGRTTVRDMGFGTMQVTACDFAQPGTYDVQATATGREGFQAITALVVSVVYPPIEQLKVFYSVIESSIDGTTVAFGTRRVEGADRYLWDFGDDTHDATERRTLLPQTRHPFTRRTDNQRRGTLTVVTSDGRTLATGSVVGRW